MSAGIGMLESLASWVNGPRVIFELGDSTVVRIASSAVPSSIRASRSRFRWAARRAEVTNATADGGAIIRSLANSHMRRTVAVSATRSLRADREDILTWNVAPPLLGHDALPPATIVRTELSDGRSIIASEGSNGEKGLPRQDRTPFLEPLNPRSEGFLYRLNACGVPISPFLSGALDVHVIQFNLHTDNIDGRLANTRVFRIRCP
jgi:hypothetical protein